MLSDIPDCYEADRQAEARELAHTARIMRRPKCVRCGDHLMGESYLDLESFGLNGVACEKCIKTNTHDIEGLEDD